MDHLFLPSGAAPQIFMYPGRMDYIAVPFLQYPVLAEKSSYLDIQHGGSSKLRTFWPGDEPADETRFFATWLFCGLVQEVLAIVPQQFGEGSLYRHEDFICPRTDHRGQDIPAAFCTKNLVSLLERWTILVGQHKHVGKQQHDHLKLCMEMTHKLLSWTSVKIERHVKSVIAATAELLCLAVDSAFLGAALFSKGLKCPDTWAMFIGHSEWTPVLIENGWCPSDACEVSSFNLPFSQNLLFASCLTRKERTGFYKSCPSYRSSLFPTRSEQHTSCTSKKCQVLGGPGSPQKPQIGCACEIFEIERNIWNQLLYIIDNGIALLRYCSDSSGTYTIDVIPYTKDTRFVAISHVWSDGFGNSEQNAILRCRLDCVSKSLLKSWRDVTNEDTTEVLFWLDTICCPLTPTEARKKVLRNMRSIYEEAEYVLVLDGELLNIAIADMANIEIGWRILESGWMRRLWTLQEGYLARSLWVAFADKTFRLDSLAGVEPWLSSLNQKYLWTHIKYLYWSLRKQMAKQDSVGNHIWSLFWIAVRKRQVTESTDEPLCLSTFFNLNTSAIIDAVPEDQMRLFWSLIGDSNIAIPSGIVFHQQPKLATDGYRWAPATFLNPSATDRWLLGSSDTRLTSNGLVLKLKAFAISRTSLSQAHTGRSESPLTKAAKRLQLKNLCYVRDQHGVWYSLVPHEIIEETARSSVHASAEAESSNIASSLDESFTSKTFPDLGARYVVLQHDSIDLALLTIVREQVNNMDIVTPLKRVVMIKEASFQAPAFEIARAEAHIIAQSDGFSTIDVAGLFRAVEAGAKHGALRLEQEGVTLPASFDEQRKVLLMATKIVQMLTDQHYVDAMSLPPDTEWCVT